LGELIDDVRLADPKIAARWQARVARKMAKPILTSDDIDYIVAELVRERRSDITPKQGEALILITNASIQADPDKADPGIKRFIHYVDAWNKAHRLNMTAMVTDQELQPIADFLGSAEVAKVNFTSPGTGTTYAPFDYIAVGQLILDRDVTFFMSKTSGLSEYASERGSYMPGANIMQTNTASPLARRTNIVHESTHVIQDWQDVSSMDKFDEADAWIAQAVVYMNLTKEAPGDDISKAAAVAADMIDKKTATAGNKAWKTAYDNVVKAVVKEYRNDGKRNNARLGDTIDEKAKFQRMLKEIATMNAARDVIVRKTAEVLLQLIP
jgi:hypothetical protein